MSETVFSMLFPASEPAWLPHEQGPNAARGLIPPLVFRKEQEDQDQQFHRLLNMLCNMKQYRRFWQAFLSPGLGLSRLPRL